MPFPAKRLNGGNVLGGLRRGGNSASNEAVAVATTCTARSIASAVAADVDETPLTLRTYCRAAASTSSAVAAGSSPRSVVMLRHMAATLRPTGPVDTRARRRQQQSPRDDSTEKASHHHEFDMYREGSCATRDAYWGE